MAIDIATGRLFVAALAANAVETIDVKQATLISRLDGQHEPQGLTYLQAARRLLVANGASGTVDAFEGDKSVGAIRNLADADNLRLDPATGHLYVGYGSAIAVVDPLTLRILDRFSLPGHPEAFVLATRGPQIYVNVPSAGRIVVIDRRSGKTTAAWNVAPASRNFPMALDEREERLFIATRQPARLQVYDTSDGRRTAELSSCGDADDLFFDTERRQLYAVCGDGLIEVVQQRDRDHYEVTQRLSTAAGARTGLFVSEMSTLFVAAPARGRQPAQVRVYRIR